MKQRYRQPRSRRPGVTNRYTSDRGGETEIKRSERIGGAMTSWRCYWARRQQKRKVLSLLSLSGAVRFGAERLLGKAGCAGGRPLEAVGMWGRLVGRRT